MLSILLRDLQKKEQEIEELKRIIGVITDWYFHSIPPTEFTDVPDGVLSYEERVEKYIRDTIMPIAAACGEKH